VLNTREKQFISAPNPVSARFLQIQISSTRYTATQKRENKMWQPGDVISWRGIYRNRIWHVQPTILVKDSPEEVVTTLLPGTECIADENYPKGKKHSKRRWHFIEEDWHLARYTWQRNRLLLIFEPEKYYSTILFWNHASNEFLCYYINFQVPLQRNHCALDTLDLDLDIIINPDFTYEWKDEDDYEQAIERGVIFPEWIAGIERSKVEIFDRLEKRQYPFDGSWLNWMPEASWVPPELPEDWDKI
jgi:protein associated with RNAse G/E